MPDPSSSNEIQGGSTGRFSWEGDSHIGQVREENQDAFFADPETGLFLVSDGMGGHQGGAMASQFVIEELPVFIENQMNRRKSPSIKTIRNILKNAAILVNQHVYLEGNSETGFKNMGATIVLILVHGDRVYLANIGDSRCYRLRQGRLTQLSKDHTVISRLIDQGHLHPEEARNHSAQGLLTQCVGMPEDAVPFLRSFQAKPSDRILLCSDGLTDMMTDREITKLLRNEEQSCEAAKKLVNRANQAGGHDNITAVVIDLK